MGVKGQRQINVYLEEHEIQDLNKIARGMGLPRMEVMRRFLRRGLTSASSIKVLLEVERENAKEAS